MPQVVITFANISTPAILGQAISGHQNVTDERVRGVLATMLDPPRA